MELAMLSSGAGSRSMTGNSEQRCVERYAVSDDRACGRCNASCDNDPRDGGSQTTSKLLFVNHPKGAACARTSKSDVLQDLLELRVVVAREAATRFRVLDDTAIFESVIAAAAGDDTEAGIRP